MNRQLLLWEDELAGTKPETSVNGTIVSPATASTIALELNGASRAVHQLFTNPDRQFLILPESSEDWPPAICNEDAISIDRPRPDIDGPAHRFTIERTDYVEVYLGDSEVGYGEVVAIAPEKRQVRVSLDGDATEWFDVEDIYPAQRPKRTSKKRERCQAIADEIQQIQETITPGTQSANRVKAMSAYTSIKVVTLTRSGTLEGRAKITSTADACQFFEKYWAENPGQDQERFIVACLDTKHRVQSVVPITVGTLDASLVHPREVFKPAIIEGSSAILLSHNHPSGDPTPSQEDRQVTERLTDAGKLIGITVLDHIVHGDGTGKVASSRET